MKRILFIAMFFCVSLNLNAQQTLNDSISQTIVCFLRWHKVNHLQDLDNQKYAIIKNIIISKKLKKQSINKINLEKYLSFFRYSKLLSETYINNLRGYFYDMDKILKKSPPVSIGSIVKIDGLDLDFILQSFEPEEILNHIDDSKLGEVLVLENKAIAKFNIPSTHIKMLFTLTKVNEKWLIDYIGYYD